MRACVVTQDGSSVCAWAPHASRLRGGAGGGDAVAGAAAVVVRGPMQIINQRTATVPLDSISADPVNPNQGDIGAISESIQSSGFFGHVLVQESTGRIIAGAHRHAAARALGATEIPVTYVDVDDERARRIMLADNRTARLGSDNPEALASLLQELAATPAALGGTGYDGAALDELLADLGQGQPELVGDPDAVPEVPDEPITRRGQVITLGRHRLICGDSTDAADVERLMGGETAVLCLTDPPYSCAYEDQEREPGRPTRRDKGDAYRDPVSAATLLRGFIAHLPSAMLVMTYLFGRHFHALADATRDFDLLYECVWLKDHATFILGRRYQPQHEPLLIFRRKGARGTFNVPSDQTTVLAYDRAAANEEHPTAKPVELWRKLVECHSDSGDLVYDPFGGSGTTLVACEATGRRCFMMEIEPAYCDVICQRFKDLTGITPIRPSPARDLDMVK